MRFILKTPKLFCWSDQSCPVVIGSGGLLPPDKKREGDGATPFGEYLLRRVLYRPDRISAPVTTLPLQMILPDDGWCDAPNDPAYNRPIRLPYPTSAEALCRKDHVYDLVVVLGHNDHPPVPFAGSAIFLHLMQPDQRPTRGCVAFLEKDLRYVLACATKTSTVCIPDTKKG